MSQYMQFFIRCEDKFVPLCSYSRNNTIFKAFAYDVPYGNIIPITETILSNAREYLSGEKDVVEDRIRICRDMVEAIHHFDNSVKDKLEAIRLVNEDIFELEGEKEEIGCANHFVNTCGDILISAKYRDDGYDCPLTDYTENTVLYAGIEVSAYPTMDDVDPNK